MATIKSFTSLEQSKKLAKILPLESADYCWGIDYESRYLNFNNLPYVRPYNTYENKEDFIPCWSLAALLDVIPKHIKGYNVLRIDIGDNDTSIWYEEIGCGVNNNLPDITMEFAVDACYDMILKLNELEML